MSRKKQDWWDIPLPPVIPLTHLRVAEDRGADVALLLRDAGLPPDFITRPFELRIIQMHGLVNAILARVGDNGLGIDIGMRLPPTAFGNFGYALLCSETVRDVMRLCRQYWHLVARGTTLHVTQENDLYIAQVATLAPLPAINHRIVMETTFSSVSRGFQLLAPAITPDVEIWFDFPAPMHADKIRQVLGKVRFDMPANQLRAKAEILDIRLNMYNPTGLTFALEQCERENALAELDTHEILAKVRSKIVFTGQGYPGLETVSQQLNMTARTLRRRLEEEGTTFKALIEEAKRRDAIRLLDDHALPVHKIADLLGYNDPANFTRAFRQWTHQTPSEYRSTRISGE